MSVQVRVVVVSVLALSLLVAGWVLWSTAGPASFGWFAYAPLAGEVSSPGFAFLTPQMQVALGLAVGGLVLLAGLVGFWLGRRRPQGTNGA